MLRAEGLIAQRKLSQRGSALVVVAQAQRESGAA